MASREDRRYLESHEWHKVVGDVVVIGISRFAVDELTDITFLDIKRKSGPVKAGQTIGEIESVKATSDLYSGIDGEVVAFNQEAIDKPEILNEDPWEKGWLIKVKPASMGQVEGLLSAKDYDQKTGQ